MAAIILAFGFYLRLATGASPQTGKQRFLRIAPPHSQSGLRFIFSPADAGSALAQALESGFDEARLERAKHPPTADESQLSLASQAIAYEVKKLPTPPQA